MQKLEEEIRQDSGNLIRRVQDELKTSAEKEARKIITMAIERYAADQVSEITTCSVALPNDEMKGRIIGREGRNIRVARGGHRRQHPDRRHAGSGGDLRLRSPAP